MTDTKGLAKVLSAALRGEHYRGALFSSNGVQLTDAATVRFEQRDNALSFVLSTFPIAEGKMAELRVSDGFSVVFTRPLDSENVRMEGTLTVVFPVYLS